jgi:cytidylate kinase
VSIHFEIPRVQDLVARQIALWRIENEATRERGGAAADQPLGPYLTIARQHGAGGTELGRRVARALGWELYDHSLLEKMAERGHLEAAALEKVESGPHDRLREAILLTLDRTYPGHHAYLKNFVAVVSAAAARGNVVLLGRGAHLLLPRELGVRLWVIAPLERRIRAVMEARGCDARAAERWIQEADASEAALVRNLFHRDADEIGGYDLVINRDSLSLAVAEATVIAAVRARVAALERAAV